MFNKNKIDTLYGIVGLRGSDNPLYQILDAANLASASGYFVDDNPYCKVELYKDNQDYSEITDLEFNTNIKNLQESAISSVCNAVFSDSDYIDRQVLYRYAQNKVNTESLPVGFIGYKITPNDTKSLAFSITRDILSFNGTGDIELMIFNSSKKEVVFSQIVPIISDHQVVELDWTLDDTDGLYKGEYYYGYNTNGLTVQPYKRDYNNSNIESIISDLYIENIFVNGHDSNTLFDLTAIEGNSLSTGLNPDITVYEDYTDLILNNKKLFAKAINLDMQIKMIGFNLASIRSNKTQRLGEAMVVRMLQEIDGQSGDGVVKIAGLRPMLIGEVKRLSKEIESLRDGYFQGSISVYTDM
tara:strand:- start:689 stop:1756 length:1068 start_codon:yes stop_codon:yes gene_type:complete